jgi:hypothetical protein
LCGTNFLMTEMKATPMAPLAFRADSCFCQNLGTQQVMTIVSQSHLRHSVGSVSE